MEDILNKLVDVTSTEYDSADTVCVPRLFISNLTEKIDTLPTTVNKQMEMMADLEVRNEMKMQESRIMDMIESSKTQPCSSAESNSIKTSKRKQASVPKDKNKPCVNWADDGFLLRKINRRRRKIRKPREMKIKLPVR